MTGRNIFKTMLVIFSFVIVFGISSSMKNIIFSSPGTTYAKEEPQNRSESNADAPEGEDPDSNSDPGSEDLDPTAPIEDGTTSTSTKKPLGTGVDIPGSTGVSDFGSYISAILKFARNAGIALATLMLIFAGYKYMTSQGNPTAINEAKEIVSGAIIGLILLLLIGLILSILNLPNITIT